MLLRYCHVAKTVHVTSLLSNSTNNATLKFVFNRLLTKYPASGKQVLFGCVLQQPKRKDKPAPTQHVTLPNEGWKNLCYMAP